MPSPPPDYIRFFPAAPELRVWGVGITIAGFATIHPGALYPPLDHPADHEFDWSQGRVLDALQIVLISSGRGWLETREIGRRRIEAGMVFLLLPQIWHQYHPDPTTGWQESWIELQGPVVEQLLTANLISPTTVLRLGAIEAGLDAILETIHRQARDEAAILSSECYTAALQALALCAHLDTEPTKLSPIQQAIQSAEKYLNEHYNEPVNIEGLARDLGVGYTNFRRVFRIQTGLSPWQYLIQVRLAQARHLLASSEAKLDDIAGQVGFSNSFHLSRAFKQVYGEAPSTWRRSCQQYSPPNPSWKGRQRQ